MSTHLLLIHAVSPIHAGTGHSPGAIDLPIARDKATGFPLLPGSGIKGAMRADLTRRDAAKVKSVFGPDTTGAAEHAGGLWVGDANLVCLPVRSVVGTFAWVTSPFLVGRFLRDAKEAGLKKLPAPPKGPPRVSACQTPKRTSLEDAKRVYFEDLDFQLDTDDGVGALADWLAGLFFEEEFWRARFSERFCLVHDDVMAYLSAHGTDVVNRIRLDNDTKTVARGALWSEESLPTESLLASMIVLAPNTKTATEPELRQALSIYHDRTLQLGGDATVGRGRCALRIVSGGAR